MWTISGESYTCNVINHLLLSIQLFVCLCIIVMFFHCFLIVRVKANFCSTFYRNSVRAHRPTFVNTGDTEKKNSRNMPSRLTMDIVELNCLRPLSSISEGFFCRCIEYFLHSTVYFASADQSYFFHGRPSAEVRRDIDQQGGETIAWFRKPLAIDTE